METPEQRARKIVDGCIQELRFGGEHTDMSQVEPVRQIALDQLRDRIAAALVEAGGPRRSCPCLHTEPCQPDCTCVKPFMSHGCSFCCSYGSVEQQRVRAEHLRKLILLGLSVEAGGAQGLPVGAVMPNYDPLGLKLHEPAGPQGEYECDGINCPPRAHDHKVLDVQADLISREAAAELCEGLVTFAPEHEKYAPADADTPCGWCDGLELAAERIRALPAASTGECVWTRRQRGDHFWYTTECATVHDAMRFGEFCPYCGKQLVEHPTGKPK